MPEPESWSRPPPELRLKDDEVHVWRVPLELAADQLAAMRLLLDAEERTLADRLVRPLHRVRAAVARGSLRWLLGRYLGAAPQSVRFQLNPHGKPSLAGDHQHSGLRFNLSHSQDLALMAFTHGRELGVDIERIDRSRPLEKLARRFFTAAEARRLEALPDAERPRAFFECWTRKEAYVKARGRGLSLPLDSFQVGFGPGVAPSILEAVDEAAPRWAVSGLEPAAGFLGALVVERPLGTLRCWRLE